MKYKKELQDSLKDCGVMCLLYLIRYYGGNNTRENIRNLTKCDKNGITAYNLIEASKKLGFDSYGVKCKIENIINNDILLPCIAHVILENKFTHYIIIENIDTKKRIITIYDPSIGIKKIDCNEFISIWSNIILIFKPIRKLDNIKQNNPYKVYFNILFKSKLLYFFVIIVTVISIFFTILSSFYFKLMYDNSNYINNIFIAFLSIVLLKCIFDFIRNLLIIIMDSYIDKKISLLIIKKVLSLPYNYFNTRFPGEIIHKINESDSVIEMLVKIPIIFIVNIGIIILSSYILFVINYKLFLFLLIFITLYFIIFIIFNKKNINCTNNLYENKSNYNVNISECIHGIYTIKNQNLCNYVEERIEQNLNYYIKEKRKYEHLYNFQSLLKDMIILIGINILIYIGFVYVNSNVIKVSDLILFNSIMLYLIESFKSIFDLEPMIKSGIVSMKKISEIFDINNKESNYSEDNIFYIKIKNLNAYSLKNFSIDINLNDSILLKGRSGTGKTTLLKIITKQIEVVDNTVFLNKVDINKWNDYSIRNRICYVSNSEKIFNGTILENVILDTKVEEDKIIRIFKILDMEYMNINQYITEENNILSLGERQKVILARTLIKDIDVLILDEALDGIDIYQRDKILNKIKEIFNNKIFIYVSHNDIDVNIFSRIIYLDDKERGINGIHKN